MSKIGKSCAIFKDILGMHMEEEKALAIHDVMEMPTHNGFTKEEMMNVIKWLWHQKYRLDDEPMTNADRIRNLTDEELAEFLVKVNTAYAQPCMISGGDCKWEDYPTRDKGCKDCFLEWLQAEVKEG